MSTVFSRRLGIAKKAVLKSYGEYACGFFATSIGSADYRAAIQRLFQHTNRYESSLRTENVTHTHNEMPLQ